MEPGNGGSRNQYLRDHNVHTYFIIPPARRRKVSIDFYFTRQRCQNFRIEQKRGKRNGRKPYAILRMFVACLFSLCFAFLDPSVRPFVRPFASSKKLIDVRASLSNATTNFSLDFFFLSLALLIRPKSPQTLLLRYCFLLLPSAARFARFEKKSSMERHATCSRSCLTRCR